MEPTSNRYLLAAVVVGVVVLAGGWYWYQNTHKVDGGVACTMEAKQCPDGSYVGRSGPKCEFAACPTATTTGDGTGVSENLILGQNPDKGFGVYLSAYNGMTVYTSRADQSGVSNCVDACAAAWPPYTVPSPGAINVPANIKGAVGTIKRADGTLQVTYKGMPLYFWMGDTKPEDTTGQEIGGFTAAKP